jgi:hypothetical protein
MGVMEKIESLTLPLIIIFKFRSQSVNPVWTKSKNSRKSLPTSQPTRLKNLVSQLFE